MTIYLTLDWQPNEQFLFVFTFADDYETSNLRANYWRRDDIHLPGNTLNLEFENEQKEVHTISINTMYTWAPSHVEVGLMADLLSLANRINGSKKRFGLQKELVWFKNTNLACKSLRLLHETHKDEKSIVHDRNGIIEVCKGKTLVGWPVNQKLIDWLKIYC